MALRASDVELMLAEPGEAPFSKPGWVFELKLDGFRMLAERVGGKVALSLRRGRDATALFPEIARALEGDGPDVLLDGELVIQDAQGKPLFERLLKRSSLTGKREIERAMREHPVSFFAFDLLMLNGEDLREQPLLERKKKLLEVLPKGDRVLPLDHVEENGVAFFEAVKARGLEGVMAKRADAPYRAGRSSDWLKLPLKHTGDFVVVGHTESHGALYLAISEPGGLVYAGKVGSGFTPRLADSVKDQLVPVPTPHFGGEVPREKEAVWVEPRLVCEVRYKLWRPPRAPREPVFLRFRDDKAPEECVAPWAARAGATKPRPVARASKVFFPGTGITKGEVVDYYRAVAPWMLPYLRDRPLTLTRYPDGIAGKRFFQKAKPKGAPDFLRTVTVHDEEDGTDMEQLVCDDARSLEWCASMGALPLHLPAGRLSSPGRADWCVIDFDPKGAPFDDVVTLANTLHALCTKAGLPAYVKTSGASGLHVLVPLGGQLDFAQSRQLAEVLAALLVQHHPKLATVERMLKRREGKVYVDAGQNGPGRLIAAPFCVRAEEGAPVSMPLEWREVKRGLSPRDFTIRNAVPRLEKHGDPMAKVLTQTPDVPRALERLSQPGTAAAPAGAPPRGRSR